MPVYEYHCKICSMDFDLRRSISERDLPAKHFVCGKETSLRNVTAPLRTSSAWATFEYGVNGHYDKGLGETIYSRKHRDEIAARKGVVPFEALGHKNVDSLFDKKVSAGVILKEIENKYENLLIKHNGNESAAHLELYPDEDLLNDTGDYKKYKEANEVLSDSNLTNEAADILSGNKTVE